MEDDTPVIYGLEFQARALASQLAESDAVRFLVGTQSLKLSHNQVHVVELNEETGGLTTQVFQHGAGEVWTLTASPSDASIIATCYNTLTAENTCCMKSAVWRLPLRDDTAEDEVAERGSVNELPAVELVCQLDTEPFGQEVKVTCFHPTDGSKAASVVDNKFVVWDLDHGNTAKAIHSGVLEGKGQPRFTTGKWNPHHGCSQFVTANDGHVRSWDLRVPPVRSCWRVENAHCQLVRDFDFNPNKQYYMATCGDDGYSRFWDVRNPSEPAIARADHSHWVWRIRYNHFHDQLVLTSSSDSRVILTSVASISSEPLSHMIDDESSPGDNATDSQKEKLEDGVLATYDEHEDSVYSVEWSSADPWTFASLSYDGRLVISKVPRADKYMILL
ncbi:EARP-interacting protein homolog isoform X1 [Periplaneta americana]|uniref:EARP-interacting protein homolog isoform X1 n=1 Tax=Periplaneta americana TaxID=6978 RepID=UPI0037E7324A